MPQNLKAAKTHGNEHLHPEIVCVKNSMFPLLFGFNKEMMTSTICHIFSRTLRKKMNMKNGPFSHGFCRGRKKCVCNHRPQQNLHILCGIIAIYRRISQS